MNQKNNTLSLFALFLGAFVLFSNLILYLLVYFKPAPIYFFLTLFTGFTLYFSWLFYRVWKSEFSDVLRSEIEFNQALVEQSPLFYVSIDNHGKTILMNIKMLNALGYEAEEVKGTDYVKTFVPEEDREALTKTFDRILNHYEYLTHINKIQAKDGRIYDCEWHSIPMFDSRRKNFFIGVGKDITDRLRTEKEIEKYKTHLESLVEERTAELKTKTNQLEAINKELEFFSYSVSHDLRAPLRGINGWSLALLEDYDTSLDEKAKEYIGRVRNEAHRMEALINDLLKLAKITLSEVRLNEVNLSNLVENVVDRLRQEYSERELNIIIEPDLVVTGDSNFLDIVLTNLLSNAFKFTSKVNAPKIEFGKSQIDGEIVYFIRDNGVGFNMNHSDKLFITFQRLHRQSEFPGTGVGLAIVKRIINIHNGSLWAESSEGSGAVFYFTINKKIPKHSMTLG